MPSCPFAPISLYQDKFGSLPTPWAGIPVYAHLQTGGAPPEGQRHAPDHGVTLDGCAVPAAVTWAPRSLQCRFAKMPGKAGCLRACRCVPWGQREQRVEGTPPWWSSTLCSCLGSSPLSAAHPRVGAGGAARSNWNLAYFLPRAFSRQGFHAVRSSPSFQPSAGGWRWGYGLHIKQRVCQDALGHLWSSTSTRREWGSQACQVNDTQVFGTQSDTFGLYRDVTDCGFSVLVLVKGKTMHTLC